MSLAMKPELSNDEVQVLRTMWELKAIGTRAMSMQDLASRTGNLLDKETIEMVKHLEARGLITAKEPGGDLVALTPLGAAFVRQLEDRHLGDLNRGP